MSLSKELPKTISSLTKIMSTRQAKAALRKAKAVLGKHDIGDDYCISRVFVWSNTPQGHNFWSKMHRKLRIRNDYTY